MVTTIVLSAAFWLSLPPSMPQLTRAETMLRHYPVESGVIYGRLMMVRHGRLVVRQYWPIRRIIDLAPREATLTVVEGQWRVDRLVGIDRLRRALADCPADSVIAVRISVPTRPNIGPHVTAWDAPKDDAGWLISEDAFEARRSGEPINPGHVARWTGDRR